MRMCKKLSVATVLILSAFFVVLFPPSAAFAVCVERGTGNLVSEVNGRCPDGSLNPSVSGDLAGDQNTPIITIGGFIGQMTVVLNTIAPFIIGLAVLVILWGIFGYIGHAGEEEKRAEARQFVVWGIIGVFFMLSIWGFVNVLDRSFKLKKEPPAEFPHLPPIPGS